MATPDDHTQGCMIALMPTEADAQRLAIGGGEPADELHCTLFFLGDDATAWSQDLRNELTALVQARAAGMTPVKARVFGVAQWNSDGPKPSWVWSVGDDPDAGLADSTLEEARWQVVDALESTHNQPELPVQHSPWVAHICAAYSDDPKLLPVLGERLGPVTFDRIRLSFGDDDRDVPLEATGVSLTAAGTVLRRKVSAVELAAGTDFGLIQSTWEHAVDRTLAELSGVQRSWRMAIRAQVAASFGKDPDLLEHLELDPAPAADVLARHMDEYARVAGQQAQREAEAQGVAVPEWNLDGALTAALSGRRLLESVARSSAVTMATSLVQSARTKLTALLGLDTTPEAAATDIEDYVNSLSDAGPRDTVKGAMTTAQNTGRRAVMEAAPPATYYASEILDKNTCLYCRTVDGKEFGTLAEAIAQYPVMGYKDCKGGTRCRGMIVAKWSPVTASAALERMHGTIGNPGYHMLHPHDRRTGKDRTAHGGLVGSDRYSSEQHEQALESYTDNAFRDMNEWLRHGELPDGSDPEETKSRIDTLYDLIAIQDPLAEDTTLYRGAAGMDLEIGDEFNDRGFVSTSDHQRRGQTFAKGYKGQGQLLTIRVPAGAQVLQVASIDPSSDGEREWILPPGSRFRVVGRNSDAIEGKTQDGYELELIV
jgi:2'-5' RNA ligase